MERTIVMQTIVDEVSPFLGVLMARSSIELHCRNLKVDGPIVTPAQIDALLQKLAMGLNVFVGRLKSEQLMQQIRRRLGQRS
jgi:hypothetical protein